MERSRIHLIIRDHVTDDVVCRICEPYCKIIKRFIVMFVTLDEPCHKAMSLLACKFWTDINVCSYSFSQTQLPE